MVKQNQLIEAVSAVKKKDDELRSKDSMYVPRGFVWAILLGWLECHFEAIIQALPHVESLASPDRAVTSGDVKGRTVTQCMIWGHGQTPC